MPNFQKQKNKNEFPASGSHPGPWPDKGKVMSRSPKHKVDGEPKFLKGGILQPAPHNGGPWESDRWSQTRNKFDGTD